ncbi:MAG: cation diffusion facilitator family transporter [Candidatus Obscuribacterales bacterium]|nr:cation diffusion facilitator family transporter [Candidatus Obscuribacterales bacterium]
MTSHSGSCQNHSHEHADGHEQASAQAKSEKHSHGSHEHGSGHHHHANARNLSRKRLFAVLLLSGSFTIVEAAAGFMTHSLALIADAGHMLGDVAALALAFFAIWLSSRPAGRAQTFGYHRSEILAALANSVLLVLISIFVLFEAIQRLAHPPEIHSTEVLVIAAIGMCINLVSMRLLSDSADNSLNTKAAYLEVVSDMLASIGVILAAAIMMTTGWYIADPLISCILAFFILWRTWGLLKESIDILMENAPGHVDLEELRTSILKVKGVVAVHDMHVWTITSGMISMSGHVTIEKDAVPETVLADLNSLLEHDFEIAHTTIQIETETAALRCKDSCAIS